MIWNLSSTTKKLLFGFLIIALLAPGAYVALQRIDAEPAYAVPTEEILNIPWPIRWIIEFGLMTVEHVGYKYLKKQLSSLGHNLAVQGFRDFSQAGPGQEPLFEIRGLGDFLTDEVMAGGGLFLEGLAVGFEGATKDKLEGDKIQANRARYEAEIGDAQNGLSLLPENQQFNDTIKDLKEDVAQGEKDRSAKQKEIDASEALYQSASQTMGAECNKDASSAACKGATKLFDTRRTELSGFKKEAQDLDESIAADQANLSDTTARAAANVQEREKFNEIIKQKKDSIEFGDRGAEQKARYEELKRTRDSAQTGVSQGAQQLISGLCNPNASIALRWTFGLPQVSPEQKQLCTVEQLTKNWDAAINRTGIKDLFNPGKCCWKQLSEMVSPYGKEPYLGFQIQSSFFDQEIQDANRASNKWLAENIVGSGPVKTVAGLILTPGSTVKTMVDESVKATAQQTIAPALTGKLMADLIDLADSFAGSFAQKSFDLIMKGIAARVKPRETAQGPSGAAPQNSLNDPDAPPVYSQQKASAIKTAELAKLEFSEKDIKVLAELQTDQNCKDNPNYCVLSEGFAQAITEKMTVGEALCVGEKDCIPKLNPQGIFGFQNQGGSAKALCNENEMNNCQEFKTNFPYYIMPILRKYRVIPVGWEIAALYIKEVPNACEQGKSCTIGYVVGKYNDPTSPFYRLVDPNWVLKLPAARCSMFGYGPAAQYSSATDIPEDNKLCTDDTNGDGRVACYVDMLSENGKEDVRSKCGIPAPDALTDAAVLGVMNNSSNPKHTACKDAFDEYNIIPVRPKACLDEQTCLRENPDGSCASDEWGYCLEERKKVVFRGTTGDKCNENVVSCQSLTNAETDKTITILKRSIPGMDATLTRQTAHDSCDKNFAGCNWYSKQRKSGTQALTAAWSSASQDRVYLTSAMDECQEQFAGCTALKNPVDNSDAAFRVSPQELRCGEVVNGVPGYKRQECREYALQCDASYTGCSLYAPVDGDPRVAGTGPAACRAGCAGLTNFLEKTTDIEQRFGGPEISTTYQIFAPSSRTSCPDTEVGCEEFTDLDAARQGSGESLFTFSKIKACVARSSNPEPKNFFYSWYGSDQSGGSRLVKFEFVNDGAANPAPKCAEGASCDCAGHLNENDPIKGTCREFISVTGSLSQRWTDLLVYPVDPADCHSYRRTVGGGSNIYTLSRALSKSCRPSSVGCHEYRAPNAGNVQVIFADNFESKSNRQWYVIPSSTTTPALASPSNDTETLYETSIRHADVATLYRDLGSVTLLKNSKYLLDFMVKPDTAATMSYARLITQPQPGTIALISSGTSRSDLTATLSQPLPAGQWSEVRAFFDLSTLTDDRVTGTKVIIGFAPATGSGGVSLTADRFIFKRMEGFEYQKKGTWTVGGDSCKNDGDYSQYASQYGTYQYECRQYRPDAGGLTQNYQGFSRLCPVEMVGCTEFADPGSKKAVVADRFGFSTWSKRANKTVTTTEDILEVADTPATIDTKVFVGRPVTLKKSTAYTLTVRFKETTPEYAYDVSTGSVTRGFKTVGAQLVDGTTITDFANVDTAYGSASRQYALWKDYSFTATTPDFGTDTKIVSLVFYARGAKGSAHSYALDDIMLAEDGAPNSLYLVADPQKSCPKVETGCTAYGVPVLDSAGRIKTEVKRLPNATTTSTAEKWTEKVFRITPEQIAFATSTPGVCREEHLKCSAYKYTDTFGEEQTTKDAFFRDPGDRICTVKKVGSTYAWTKSVCPGTDDPCKKAGDCGKDASGKDIACAQASCPEVPTSTPNLPPNPNAPYWVYECPRESDTCRKITDPECGKNMLSEKSCTDANKGTKCVDSGGRFTGACMTQNADGTLSAVAGGSAGFCQLDRFALRTEYGRNNPGIACRPDYYYLSDVSTRGCDGKVDVEKGCLLFHDDEVGDATTNIYSSREYYKKYWDNVHNVNLDPQSVNRTDPFNTPTSTDANIVLKARYDRECKTALACTDYFEGGKSLVCYKRRPCEAGSNASCVKPLSPAGDGTDQLAGTFTAPVGNTTNPNLTYLSLSGLSRPNFNFPAITNPAPTSSFPAVSIGGGHNGTFNWNQTGVVSSTVQSNIAYSSSYTTYFGSEGALAVSSTPSDTGNFIMNSCRVYPRADTPDNRQHLIQKASQERSWINSCYYSKEGLANAEFRGLYGYCLEPNPKFYSGTLAEYRTLARTTPRTGGYRSYCLNWHPIDRIAQQPPLPSDASSGLASMILPLEGPRYHCVASSTFAPEQSPRQCQNRDATNSPNTLGAQDGTNRNNDCSESFNESRVTRDGAFTTFSPQSWGGHDIPLLDGSKKPIDELEPITRSYLIFLHSDHRNNSGYWKDNDNLREIPANSKEDGLLYDQIKSITYKLVYATRRNGRNMDGGEYNQTCGDDNCSSRNADPVEETITKPSGSASEPFTFIQRDADAREREYGDNNPAFCTNCFADQYYRMPITKANVFDDLRLENEGSTYDDYTNAKRLCKANRNFMGVQPRWEGTGSSKKLIGWKWRMCDSEGSYNTEAAVVAVTIDLDYSRNFGAYTDTWGTMCSEFVTLIDGTGSNVKWRTKSLPATTISKPVSDPNVAQFDPANPNSKFVLSSQYQTYEIVRPWFGNSSPMERVRSAAAAGNNSGLAVLSTDALSTDHFARLYEYWVWDGSKYVKRAHVDGNDAYQADNGDDTYKNILQSKWEARMNAATVPTIRNKDGAADSLTIIPEFSVEGANPGEKILSSDLRRVKLSFQIDAAPDQLPIRWYQIDWGDGGMSGIAWQPKDGNGYDKDDTGGGLHPYTYSHVYALDKLLNTGSTICVRAIDNFRAGVKTCADISVDSIGRFTPQGSSPANRTSKLQATTSNF